MARGRSIASTATVSQPHLTDSYLLTHHLPTYLVGALISVCIQLLGPLTKIQSKSIEKGPSSSCPLLRNRESVCHNLATRPQ